MFLFCGRTALQKNFSAHSAKEEKQKAFGKGRGGFLYINAWLTGIIRIFFLIIFSNLNSRNNSLILRSAHLTNFQVRLTRTRQDA